MKFLPILKLTALIVALITSQYSYANLKIDIKTQQQLEKSHKSTEEELAKAFITDKNSEFNGIFEKRSVDGLITSQVNYLNGKLNGKAIWWLNYNKNVKHVERNYIDGKQDGLETIWRYYNGEKVTETVYKAGEKNGLQIVWDVNGNKISETSYKNDTKDGVETGWNGNGRKTVELNWKNGKMNGLQTVWLDNGNEIQYLYKSDIEKRSIKPPKSAIDAGDFAGKVLKKQFVADWEIAEDVLKVGKPEEKDESSNTIIKEIKERCQTQMNEYGYAMIKSCVDQDIDALGYVADHLKSHKSIALRCLETMNQYGYAMVKSCIQQDVSAKEMLDKY